MASVSSAVVQQQFAALQSRALASAARFHDYNFRAYFTKHVADTFAAAHAKAQNNEAELTAFVEGRGRSYCEQLERMSSVNSMYGHTRVVIDPQGK